MQLRDPTEQAKHSDFITLGTTRRYECMHTRMCSLTAPSRLGAIWSLRMLLAWKSWARTVCCKEKKNQFNIANWESQLLIPFLFLLSVSNIFFLLPLFLPCLASPHIPGPHPLCCVFQSTSLPCQDQHFAGGQDYNCPHSTSTSASSVDVSRETWVSFWATGLLDNREQQQEPQAQEQCNDLDFLVHEDYAGAENQLSSQLYRNKQLQDTLLQKEEELARLHEENNNLRQYLNSALVKCLEQRAKKLLMQNGPNNICGCTENGKRKPKEGRYPAMDTPHPKNAKRNLFSEFAACEGQSSPAVDSWVLQTLGLKDLDTIDDSAPANYSALLSQPERSTFPQFPSEKTSYGHGGIVGLPISYENDQVASLHNTGSQQEEDLAFFSAMSNQPGALQTMSNLPPNPFPHFTSPGYTPDVSPNKTDVAFSTSLTPHCHVKTHSFQQGQAFVRRDEGGWKFTWVPKQS
ncbi:geminin coiled-coil domain-containing protein 1 [Macrotis lagotis]|uniref:geminin coiled-coil domain-containing protein 1 n=1 Tax=Macrotis lagotis TaxID=92651 RepID=UPI003D69C7BF